LYCVLNLESPLREVPLYWKDVYSKAYNPHVDKYYEPSHTLIHLVCMVYTTISSQIGMYW